MINVDEEEAKIRKQEEQKNKKMIFNNKTKSLNSVAKEDVYEKDEAEYEIKASNDSVTYPEVYDTTDHNAGEWENVATGIVDTAVVAHRESAYKNAKPCIQKAVNRKTNRPSSRVNKGRHKNLTRFGVTGTKNLAKLNEIGIKSVKSAFTKGNIALAAIGIGLDTLDDVIQLRQNGASEDIIHAAVATDITFGAVGAVATLSGSAYFGAVVGNLVCPVVGAFVGFGIAVIASKVYDSYTSGLKQKVRNWLADIF